MTIQLAYKRILVAADFSESSEAALKHAVWLSRSVNASITLAHVLPTLYRPVASETNPKMDMLWLNEGESPEEFEAAARKETDTKMRRLIEQHASSIDVQTRIFVGASFSEIVYAVEKERYDLVIAGTRGLAQWEQVHLAHLEVDLIAMGTVGRSGVQGLLLSNTAEKVLRTCDCSILTVKPDDFVSPIEPMSRSIIHSSPKDD